MVVMISFTMAFDGYNLMQLVEYYNITEKITDTSCPLSNISVFEVQNNSGSSRNYTEIVRSFDATCRRHIDTLAFKYQLQNMLFSENKILDNDIVLEISSLIVNLQMAAKKLQHIRKELNKTCCVTFTAEQYELLYFSRLHQIENNIISSLCEKAQVWQNRTDVCLNWKNYM